MPIINQPVLLRRVARGAPEHPPKGFGVAIAHALWQRGNGLLPSLIGTLNPVWGQAFAVDEGKKGEWNWVIFFGKDGGER